MAHRVTYADLRFMQSPPEEEKSQTAGSDGDDDLTYENVREAQIREEAKAARGDSPESPGLVRWSWSRVRSRRAVWVAVLGACCLVLLASAAGLGIRYWQVSEQLHQAALRRAEERLVLTERIHTCEWHLDEARGGLGSSRQSLAELWADRNRTARRLQESEAELNRSRSSLALLRQEKEQVEVALRQATACQEMVCCPRGWDLFQQKCLWVSPGLKTWEKSREDCEKKGSQLVILEKSQEVRVLWNTLMAKDETFLTWSNFWIGLVYEGHNSYAWFWLDGSSYMGTEPVQSWGNRGNNCGTLKQGALHKYRCLETLQYICEMAAMSA